MLDLLADPLLLAPRVHGLGPRRGVPPKPEASEGQSESRDFIQSNTVIVAGNRSLVV